MHHEQRGSQAPKWGRGFSQFPLPYLDRGTTSPWNYIKDSSSKSHLLRLHQMVGQSEYVFGKCQLLEPVGGKGTMFWSP
eukprot:CAMPEP_0174293846 /NCGR_PEP_ID=MMETSP0809-20121228/39866_1 /TAXON_ID=73025 ORGANISM="Eutreptiella gymnastica-like, Strain CCMP1594" /NCGR_SAMPLE_ID=MMETSP0809 /ASSEMBLY_ACC=CAM_ASM_000658 /LENGTH=78 /DNA_ID=CAMNT_0015394915 /DNA_START=59 /DNA_END=292 /DNA_ORIENTATION=+